jgi:hypothetical protein
MLQVRRIVLMIMLVLPFAGAFAQETSEAAKPAETAQVAKDAAKAQGEKTETVASDAPQTSQDVRNQFSQLLRESPSELGTILALDPTLLSNEAYLNGYPALAEFIHAHPEVRRNPNYFLERFQVSYGRDSLVDRVLEGLMIVSMFTLCAFALGWFIRTIIEQRRWNRLSRTQSEVHNKILDRFSTSEELIAYVRSPAGTKFLESAPIPLHAEQVTQNMPVTRMLWSIQFGVIVIAGAIGLLLMSGRLDPESSKEIFGLGMVAFCVGAGFVASAVISLILSRRLGVWRNVENTAALEADQAGSVR